MKWRWIHFVRRVLRDLQDQRMSLFVSALENLLTAEDIDTHLEGCLGCGNCGTMCAWYLVSNERKHHPKIKSDFLRMVHRRFLTTWGMILGKIRLLKTPSIEDFDKAKEIFFSCCTMCGRCSLACPQGVSNRRISYLVRACLTAAGIMPEKIREIQCNAKKTGHSFGLSFEESVGKILEAGIELGIEIPVDKFGAKWLWVCSAILNSKMPQAIAMIAEILNEGSVDYTISSRIIDTGTEVRTTCVDIALGRKFVRALAEEAVRLGCKGLIIGECGCDMRVYQIDDADLLRKFGLEVAYIDALILDLAKKGKIFLSPLGLSATYHDPCWTARLTGYVEASRELLRLCVENLVEMSPNRQANYCCNGGAGALRMWPSERSKDNLRLKASVLKAQQLRQTGVGHVFTPCTTCFLSLSNIVETCDLGMEVEMVGGAVYRAMKKFQTEESEGRHA